MENQKENILKRTNQGLEVFEFYIPDQKTEGQKKNIRAVFREDGKNADAHVFYSENLKTWIYHDFVNGESLNPFDFVMKLKNCNFNEAISTINKDVLLNSSSPAPNVPSFKLIQGNNYNYWFQYGDSNNISNTLERYGVSTLASYIYNNGKKNFEVKASDTDPIFAFCISDNCYKIYRPNATDKKYKHLWLGKKPSSFSDLFGLKQLPEQSDYIIIVEGLKDTITANANGIPAIGIDHAGTRLVNQEIETLRKKYTNIILCLDIDEAGINASNKLSKEHKLPQLILPKELLGENGKDISDYFLEKNSAEKLDKLIREAYQKHTELSEKLNPVPEIKDSKTSKFEKVERLIDQVFSLRYNEVSNEIEYKKKDSDDNFTVMNENNVYRFLQHNHIEFSMAKLMALLKSDFVARFNPFKSYFNNLTPWNELSDIDYIQKLSEYIPVTDQERFALHFKKAFVRTVACSLDETVINKQALILVHEEQNSGKSTFIRWLCPAILQQYMAENISTDKDSLIALCENFIINMDELATLSRAEINSLKSMFSKETIKIRRPYDKCPTSAPRRASFFGSTNKAEFLTDETGSVRWLCFELTGIINWDYKKDLKVDDIWRQAYSLYKQGFKYELTAEEIKVNDEANQQYQITTPEIEFLQKHFIPGTKDDHEEFYQATDFLTQIGDKYPGVKLNLNNLGKGLKILGFLRISKRTEKYPVKGYYTKIIKSF
ncbi:MAG: VapE domain-containing protein [Bacteroidota bacterium]